ncbi:hypothetical protein [Streptomyces sp. NPDC004065]|uniref:hypothetical protein n=1 Tax=Streptomyces sp. NPDC004065 TaxID=3364689 RepID=UPI00384ABE17
MGRLLVGQPHPVGAHHLPDACEHSTQTGTGLGAGTWTGTDVGTRSGGIPVLIPVLILVLLSAGCGEEGHGQTSAFLGPGAQGRWMDDAAMVENRVAGTLL